MSQEKNLAMSPPVDPFVFVAAVRYAIRRTLTDASRTVCNQVLLHADTIRADPGATSAIRREIEDFMADEHPPTMGQTDVEIAVIKVRWFDAGRALRGDDR